MNLWEATASQQTINADLDGSRRSFLRNAGAVALAGAAGLSTPFAFAQSTSQVIRPDQNDPEFWLVPRQIRVTNANTGQKGEFVYWRDGEYVMPEFLALCALVADHHEHKGVQMQPAAFDLIFATQRWYEQAQGRKPRTILTSGYRTERTNALVGGAPGGLHPKAAAHDGALEGVSFVVYARMLMAFGAGGVGLYARHVHWDVGRSPRFWRGESRES